MLTAVLGFLLGVTTVLAFQGARRGPAAGSGPSPAVGPGGAAAPASDEPAFAFRPAELLPGRRASGPPQDSAPSSLELAVAAFDAELEALAFTPDSPGTSPLAAAEFVRAAAARDNARRLLRTAPEAEVRRALGDGRAALIRWEARMDGRPVPLEGLAENFSRHTADLLAEGALLPAYSGERFRYGGTVTGDSVTELLLDRPEPGRAVLAHVVIRNTDATHLGIHLEGVERTGRKRGSDSALAIQNGDYTGVVYLRAGLTHLMIKTWGGEADWSVRLLAVDRAPALRPEQLGTSHAVFAHDSDEPLVLTYQTKGDESWRVRVVCACGAEPEQTCACTPRRRPRTARELELSGYREGGGTVRLPSRGLVLVEPRAPVRWSLQRVPDQA